MSAAGEGEEDDALPEGIPPTFRFRPTERELLRFYLLPRARGEADPFPGVIPEDDAAGASLPWDLFDRHGLGREDQAYFLACAGDPAGRACGGGVATWKKQRRRERALRVAPGGEKVACRKNTFNLHMGKGRGGGSVGWVMHEYSLVDPAPVKICHIAFTGHGQRRKRVPDGFQEPCKTPRRQVAAAAAASTPSFASGTTTVDQESGASGDEQPSRPALPRQDVDFCPLSPLLDSAAAPAEKHPELRDAQAQHQTAMVQEPAAAAEQQQYGADDREFWRSMNIDVQSDWTDELWASSGPAGVESDDGAVVVVPDMGDVAGGQQDALGSWAVPDMADAAAAGALSSEDWAAAGCLWSNEDWVGCLWSNDEQPVPPRCSTDSCGKDFLVPLDATTSYPSALT